MLGGGKEKVLSSILHSFRRILDMVKCKRTETYVKCVLRTVIIIIIIIIIIPVACSLGSRPLCTGFQLFVLLLLQNITNVVIFSVSLGFHHLGSPTSYPRALFSHLPYASASILVGCCPLSPSTNWRSPKLTQSL